MIKKIYFIFILLSFSLLCSCTTLIKDHSLYDSYNTYSNKLKPDNSYSSTELESWFNQFSPRYQSELLNGRKKTPAVLNHMIANNLNIPIKIEKVLSHFETSNPKYSCLLINTVSKKNERISLYFRYINDKIWLIDNIAIEYLADFEDYLTQPICDTEILMKKRMESWK